MGAAEEGVQVGGRMEKGVVIEPHDLFIWAEDRKEQLLSEACDLCVCVRKWLDSAIGCGPDVLGAGRPSRINRRISGFLGVSAPLESGSNPALIVLSSLGANMSERGSGCIGTDVAQLLSVHALIFQNLQQSLPVIIAHTSPNHKASSSLIKRSL